jgi:hypothetical protein
MLAAAVNVAVRFGLQPSEVMAWPLSDLELVLGQFLIEREQHLRAEAEAKAQANVRSIRGRR